MPLLSGGFYLLSAKRNYTRDRNSLSFSLSKLKVTLRAGSVTLRFSDFQPPRVFKIDTKVKALCPVSLPRTRAYFFRGCAFRNSHLVKISFAMVKPPMTVGHIYGIRDPDGREIYVGSTTKTQTLRWGQWKANTSASFTLFFSLTLCTSAFISLTRCTSPPS